MKQRFSTGTGCGVPAVTRALRVRRIAGYSRRPLTASGGLAGSSGMLAGFTSMLAGRPSMLAGFTSKSVSFFIHIWENTPKFAKNSLFLPKFAGFLAGRDLFSAENAPFSAGYEPFSAENEPFSAGYKLFSAENAPFSAGYKLFSAENEPFPAGYDPYSVEYGLNLLVSNWFPYGSRIFIMRNVPGIYGGIAS